MFTPLAERIRPKTLDDYIGQEHLVGENGILTKQIKNGFIPSIIFWGPPGTGKTTLAEIISKSLERPFYNLSAISSGIKEVKEIISKAKNQAHDIFATKNPILFIDEIHRFNKTQQDALLGAVEKGIVTLIGATTENPSFEVVSSLLSRCQVYVLNSFSKTHLEELLKRAIKEDKILSQKKIFLKETEAIIRFSGGDGRKLLNILEILTEQSLPKEQSIKITNQVVTSFLQNNPSLYDKNGEQHYDIISAFIKSIRGSDPNGAIYWLARMIQGGEDLKFIARRLLILASEDIGLANPTALVIANSTFQAVQTVGYPEARIILSECTIYLATSAKSNSAYLAIDKAIDFCKKNKEFPVPLHLRNAPTKLMKELKYGQEYKYPHDYKESFVEQDYLPKEIKDVAFYIPKDNPKENSIKENLKKNP